MKTTARRGGHEERLPHRLALAGVAAQLGAHLRGAVHHGAGVGGDLVGRVGAVGVDDDDLVSSATVSTSASRTRVTTSPTVAASLRAGTTRLTAARSRPWRPAGRRATSRPVGGAGLVAHQASLASGAWGAWATSAEARLRRRRRH